MSKLHDNTPVIASPKLSKYVKSGNEVLLKLDNLQPGGSFKIRGIGHLVKEGIKNGKKSAVSSSGGNAGLAAAIACKACGIPCTVIVPQSTPAQAVENVKEAGASVEVFGEYWDIADQEARRRITDDSVLYINPFDHPLIWDGHASIIDELKDINPSLIICCVGGGGLLLGILKGLERNSMSSVPVLAMETHGAHSLNATLEANEVVVLDGIKSIAKSLGSAKVADQCLPVIKNHKGPVYSKLCHDTEAIDAVEKFLADHRFFVEPACGASLAAVYSGYVNEIKVGDGPIVMIVCGGSAVSVDFFKTWRQNAHS